jgi:hypothetical protein
MIYTATKLVALLAAADAVKLELSGTGDNQVEFGAAGADVLTLSHNDTQPDKLTCSGTFEAADLHITGMDATLLEKISALEAKIATLEAVTDVALPSFKAYTDSFAPASDDKNTSVLSVGVFTQATGGDGDNPASCVTPMLGSITLIEGIQTIGAHAFYSCAALESVVLPNSTQIIEKGAFAMTGLKSVNIPDSVHTIGQYAFQRTNLKSLTIPSSVQTIGYDALAICTSSDDYGPDVMCVNYEKTGSLSLTVDSAAILTSLKNALSSTPLASVVFGETLQANSDYTYYGTSTATTATIPDTELSVPPYAFYKTPLTSLVLGSAVQTIGDSAFQNTVITGVTIPSSVQTIGDSAFQNTAITSVTIGSSVQSLGYKAFGDMTSSSVSLTVNSGSVIRNAFSGSTVTALTIGDSVTSIPYHACQDMSALTCVSIGSSVQTIGGYAFLNTGLTSVTIPNSVTSVGFQALGISTLTSVTIGSGLTSSDINPDAFNIVYDPPFNFAYAPITNLYLVTGSSLSCSDLFLTAACDSITVTYVSEPGTVTCADDGESGSGSGESGSGSGTLGSGSGQ